MAARPIITASQPVSLSIRSASKGFRSRNLAAEMADGPVLTHRLREVGKMLHGGFNPFLQRRRGQKVPGLQIVAHFAQNPGISDGRAADHYCVTAGVPQHSLRIEGIPDVAIADHRDLDSFFDVGDPAPIRAALESLRGSAAMKRECLCAELLKLPRERN